MTSLCGGGREIDFELGSFKIRGRKNQLCVVCVVCVHIFYQLYLVNEINLSSDVKVNFRLLYEPKMTHGKPQKKKVLCVNPFTGDIGTLYSNIWCHNTKYMKNFYFILNKIKVQR